MTDKIKTQTPVFVEMDITVSKDELVNSCQKPDRLSSVLEEFENEEGFGVVKNEKEVYKKDSDSVDSVVQEAKKNELLCSRKKKEDDEQKRLIRIEKRKEMKNYQYIISKKRRIQDDIKNVKDGLIRKVNKEDWLKNKKLKLMRYDIENCEYLLNVFKLNVCKNIQDYHDNEEEYLDRLNFHRKFQHDYIIRYFNEKAKDFNKLNETEFYQPLRKEEEKEEFDDYPYATVKLCT